MSFTDSSRSPSPSSSDEQKQQVAAPKIKFDFMRFGHFIQKSILEKMSVRQYTKCFFANREMTQRCLTVNQALEVHDVVLHVNGDDTDDWIVTLEFFDKEMINMSWARFQEQELYLLEDCKIVFHTLLTKEIVEKMGEVFPYQAATLKFECELNSYRLVSELMEVTKAREMISTGKPEGKESRNSNQNKSRFSTVKLAEICNDYYFSKLNARYLTIKEAKVSEDAVISMIKDLVAGVRSMKQVYLTVPYDVFNEVKIYLHQKSQVDNNYDVQFDCGRHEVYIGIGRDSYYFVNIHMIENGRQIRIDVR